MSINSMKNKNLIRRDNRPRNFNTKILIALHKPYSVPRDESYFPIFCGHAGKSYEFGGQTDDSGENISRKNAYYSELTALYWAWKNLQCDIIGLVHYRRYFFDEVHGVKRILRKRDFEEIMTRADILLPKKLTMEKGMTIWEHYAAVHCEEDLQFVRQYICSNYPEYVSIFDCVMQQKSIHVWNMFCMPKARFDAYCAWLFPILFALEERIDFATRSDYQKRACGFMSERLFNVWIAKENLHIEERDVWNLEKHHRVRTWMQMKWNGFFKK